MKKVLLTAMIGVAMGAQVGSAMAGDAQAGASKAASCMACHGAEGAAPIMPGYPKLNGQDAVYLEQTLTGFKDGSRTGGQAALMTAQVASLSAQDIKDIAAYFASVK